MSKKETTLQKYRKLNRRVGSFGIKYLDDKLSGILLGDLIVIGARSGAGKTSLANSIAMINKDVTKVSLFSLEDFDGDIFLQRAYYAYKKLSGNYDLNVRLFVDGSVELNEEYAVRAEQIAKDSLKGINIISRTQNHTIEDLKDRIIYEVEQEGSELIIIDHLDYVDKEGNESDNQHMNELMRTIRKVQDTFKVGIIAISHLRKPYNSKEAPIVPSMDEFIGSSSKVKEATAVVVLAPDDEGNISNDDKSKRGTWCGIRKLRLGGVDNTVAKIFYDVNTGKYIDFYESYRVNYSGSKIEPMRSISKPQPKKDCPF